MKVCINDEKVWRMDSAEFGEPILIAGHTLVGHRTAPLRYRISECEEEAPAPAPNRLLDGLARMVQNFFHLHPRRPAAPRGV